MWKNHIIRLYVIIMTEERKQLLEKLKQDKEKLIEIKKKHGKEYEELEDNFDLKKRISSKKWLIKIILLK